MSDTDFQAFQRAFARHIRDPRRAPRPAGVPARRMAVYNELLFNNITGFLDSCFPVCRTLLGDRRWRRLNRSFFRDWPARTPWFRDIPHEFLNYLNGGNLGQPLPAWLPDLAHYEWAELALDILEAPPPPHNPDGDLMQDNIALNPALFNLHYDWPVHHIGPNYRPRKPRSTHLIVFRDADEHVQFVEATAVTARLVERLATAPDSGTTLCREIAAELGHPDPAQLLDYGAALLNEFRQLGIVLGTLNPDSAALA